MRRISTFGAAVAGLAFAISPALLAQQDTTQQDTTSSNAGSHVQDTRLETSPSNAQNDPDRGAQDPARIGTMTKSNQDTNNNRLPTASRQGTVTQTTSPSTTYEAPPASTSTTTTETTTDTTTPAPATDTTTPPATLPRTASRVPLAGLTGLAALGAALAVRSRRLLR
jgi:hypothetical protein